MKTKITLHNYKIDLLKGVLPLVLLLFSFADALGQTVTNVSPTRVTNGSVVTVTGTGFASGTTVSISNNITINSITRTPTEIRFTIGNLTGDDRPGTLTIGGPTGFEINYVAPKLEILTSGHRFLVQEIYTNWNYDKRNFWSSKFYWDVSGTAREAASPNDKHELLGYKINNIIYSTGVDDDLLEEKLVQFTFLAQAEIDNENMYKPSVFKAYSTNGVNGVTRSDTFIITGDLVDRIPFDSHANTPEEFQTLTDIKDLTVLEAIIDGKNGLELGTGITNFNRDDEVQFFSGNGTPGAINDDGAPDLLITQIADAGASDLYYYMDKDSNVIGRPIRLQMNQGGNFRTPILSKWKMNLYTFLGGQPFAMATPNARSSDTWIAPPFRDIRMAAFKLEDFEIDVQSEVDDIENINMSAGGSADIAFMAYNAASFDIKGPVAKNVLPQYICQVDGTSSVIFKVVEGTHVGIEDYDNPPSNIRKPITTDATETFRYQLWRNGDEVTDMGDELASLTIEYIDPSMLGVYKLRVENDQGLVIIPVELIEGGVPYDWNGTTWEIRSNDYVEADPKDRQLYFASDYNENVDLEGCDCYVASGANVVIASGKVMKLYGKIEVYEGTEEDQDNEIPFTPAGIFTLENNASLIQTKEVEENENENTGNIIVKRDATGLKQYDYVYWSSPVEEGELSDIPGSSNNIYIWDVEWPNPNGTRGNWVKPPNSRMVNGRGYIKREDVPGSVNATFTGVPNNGLIPIAVKKTPDHTSPPPLDPMKDDDKHSNLIGNPYPSAINAITFLEENVNLEGYVNIWQSTVGSPEITNDDPFYQGFKYKYSADDYFRTNSLASTDPKFDGFIASGQGFFVTAKDAGEVKFTNAMRYGAGYKNNQFFRVSETTPSVDLLNEKQLIWLDLSNEANMATMAVVGYAEGATNGKDRLYDASSGSGDMRIYSILDGSDFIIQGRALPFQETDQVPLGIEILKNGIYKIGIDHLKGSIMLNEEQGIYLEDIYNNVIHDLRTTPYSFTASKGDIKDRFVLRYTNRSLSVDDQKMAETFVYIKNEQLYVKASQNIQSVVVYDLTGKKLLDYKVSGSADVINTSFQFPKGVYLTEIKLENAGVVTKKVMN